MAPVPSPEPPCALPEKVKDREDMQQNRQEEEEKRVQHGEEGAGRKLERERKTEDEGHSQVF